MQRRGSAPASNTRSSRVGWSCTKAAPMYGFCRQARSCSRVNKATSPIATPKARRTDQFRNKAIEGASGFPSETRICRQHRMSAVSGHESEVVGRRRSHVVRAQATHGGGKLPVRLRPRGQSDVSRARRAILRGPFQTSTAGWASSNFSARFFGGFVRRTVDFIHRARDAGRIDCTHNVSHGIFPIRGRSRYDSPVLVEFLARTRIARSLRSYFRR